MKKITTKMIENWIGGENFDEISSVLASVLNGDYEIEDAKNEILDYHFETQEEIEEDMEDEE